MTEQAVNLARQIKALQRANRIGADDYDIFLGVAALREVSEQYHRLWGLSGLPGAPHVEAYRMNSANIPDSAIALTFEDSAEATNTHPTPPHEARLYAKSDDGAEVLVENYQAQSWIVLGGNDLTDDLSKEPFTLENMKISRFFNSHVVSMRGRKISRNKLILYAAYAMGAVHVGGREKYSQDPDFEALRILEKTKHDRRIDIYQILLGIGQKVAFSEDAQRFTRHVLGAEDLPPVRFRGT